MAVAQRAAVRKENYLVTVLSLSFVLGMAVGVGVYIAWSRGMLGPAFSGAASCIALFFCPPYILSIAMGPMDNADLGMALMVGSVVFANGFLYAGVAALGYWAVGVMSRRGV